MTKIKAPLFSLDAAGTLDKNITYKKNFKIILPKNTPRQAPKILLKVPPGRKTKDL